MKKIEPPFVRNPYNYDMMEASNASGLECKDPSLTQQQFLEESDINFIADRYGLTGEMPQVLDLPKYGDYTGIFDFQSAQNAVRQSLEQFMTLPAKLRTRFDNDPQKLMAFLDDPENADEAAFLGLTTPRKAEPMGDPTLTAEKAPPSAPKPDKQESPNPPKSDT